MWSALSHPLFCCCLQVMHDEVSETENIRKNLSIERQIAEGCEILLDVNQIFIRQGSLVCICFLTIAQYLYIGHAE